MTIGAQDDLFILLDLVIHLGRDVDETPLTSLILHQDDGYPISLFLQRSIPFQKIGIRFLEDFLSGLLPMVYILLNFNQKRAG